MIKIFRTSVVLVLIIMMSPHIVLAENVVADGDGIIEPGENPVEEMAKAAQNPVADLISLPFQNNTNFGFGPDDDIQNVLNIQPVIPFHLSENWNLITRTIVPLINQPEVVQGTGDEFGLGDINFTAFFSPKNPTKGIIWGAGPIFAFPTATDEKLGSEKWSLGPSAVALTIQGPWLFGALINNVWSFAGDDDRDDVNAMLVQPFVNYNLPNGWYLVSSPIITANWEAASGNTWLVPLGGGVGK
ncbi:MAG: hypothetical protein V3T19_12465, partial [Acidiferrobacterales bacterium]